MNVYDRLALAAQLLDAIPTDRPEELTVEKRALLAIAHAQLAQAQLAAARAYGQGWLPMLTMPTTRTDLEDDWAAQVHAWVGQP